MNLSLRTAFTAALLTSAVAIATPAFAQLGGAVGGTVGGATGGMTAGGSAMGGVTTPSTAPATSTVNGAAGRTMGAANSTTGNVEDRSNATARRATGTVNNTANASGTANAGTLTYNAGGFAAGADYRFDPRFLAGFALGYVSGNQWASGFSGQGTTSSYQASLYASFTQGAFYLDGLAGYGYNDNQMTRQIVLPNLAARLAQGRTGANQLLGQLEAGYRVGIHEQTAASVTPFARFQGSTNSQFGFTESGAGSLNLNVAPQTTGSARSTLGAEFAGAFGPDGREKLAVQIRLGWAHEYADTTRPVTASFAGAPGANFTVFGAAPQRDGAAFSLAANTVVAPGTSLYVRYDGETGSGITNHVLNGGLRLTW